MIKRNIPFGYRMVNGDIVVNEPEAANVRQVFALYLQGASLRDISGAMTVPYNDGVGWDKHKVKRILDNPKYIGSDGYHPLIDEADFTAASKLKAGKNTSTPLPCPRDMQTLKSAAACGVCGWRFVRRIDRRISRWQCANPDCENRALLRDDSVKTSVIALLNEIINDPSLVRTGQPLRKESLAVIKLQNEVNREMSKPKPDAGHVQRLLLSLAAEKYASRCDTHFTLALRAIFESHKPADHLDCRLFDATVDKVLIAENGKISLRLKNGQILPAAEQP